jgi:hypothetical protein
MKDTDSTLPMAAISEKKPQKHNSAGLPVKALGEVRDYFAVQLEQDKMWESASLNGYDTI